MMIPPSPKVSRIQPVQFDEQPPRQREKQGRPLPKPKGKKSRIDIKKLLFTADVSTSKKSCGHVLKKEGQDSAQAKVSSIYQHEHPEHQAAPSLLPLPTRLEQKEIYRLAAYSQKVIDAYTLFKTFKEEALSQIHLSLEESRSLKQAFEELSPHFLFQAIEHASSKFVQALLSLGLNPNIAQERGMTPLHLAILLKKYEAFKRLLAASADLYALNHQGFSPQDYLYYMQDQRFQASFSFDEERKISILEQGVQSALTIAELEQKLFLEQVMAFHYTCHLIYPQLTALTKWQREPDLPQSFFKKSLPLYLKFEKNSYPQAHAMHDLESDCLIAPYTGVVSEKGAPLLPPFSIDNSLYGNETKFILKSSKNLSPNVTLVLATDFNQVPCLAVKATSFIAKDSPLILS
ncbi:MAG: hypothetical protein K0S07_263 [Chlamydiales bacterium]|jgi:ankyrin repeat protein|nr:hypothetical protein [Chlamydiales bacterium]